MAVSELEVVARPMELGLALSELVTNALRATSLSGTPDPRVRMTIRRHVGNAEVLVEDSGPGIPVSERDRLLELGTRGDDRRPGGTGSGLFQTHETIQGRGGEMTLGTSGLGGLEVRITLPLSAPARAPHEEHPS